MATLRSRSYRLMAHSVRIFIAAALLIQTCGCTLIGVGTGALIDTGKPKSGPIEQTAWPSLEPGTPVVIALHTGDTLSGTLRSIAADINSTVTLLITKREEVRATRGAATRRTFREDSTYISLDKIAGISVPKRTSAAKTGLLVGLGFDGLILLLMLLSGGPDLCCDGFED